MGGSLAQSGCHRSAVAGVWWVISTSSITENEETPMPSTFRIPKAEITGPYGAMVRLFAKKMLGGAMPDNAYVYFHHRQVLKAVMTFEGKVKKWDALDPTLKSYAQLASAGVIGCSWCLDFGYFMAHNDGLDLGKVREVPRWRESEVFTPLEREVLEYAEAMSTTPMAVTDEMVAGLIRQLGEKAVVELTQMVALENMRSRFNSAAGLQSQGYSDVCELPLAVRSHA
jgi:AhpD family alkylhydroperoxidase